MKTEDTICFNLRNSWHLISRMYNSFGSNHDVTVSMAYVLINLHHQKGTLSTQIAPRLGMEASSITRLIKSMESKGLIYKKGDEEDARKVKVYLTDKGLEKKKISKETVRSFNKKIRSILSDTELESFITTLTKINNITETKPTL